MPSPAADLVALDTLGKLYAHGRGIGGRCCGYGASSMW
jgi:hypothetical protein